MIQELKRAAEESAKLGGCILLEGYSKSLKINSKSGINDLVTEYDIKAENEIINFLSKAFPNSMFLCEESGKSSQTTSSLRWIIDPLDGTVNYAHKVPIFSVSIAAELDGEIVVGAIYQPIIREFFIASKGGGSYMNGAKIEVSKCDKIKRSYLVTGFPYDIANNPDAQNCIELFVDIVQMGIPVRRLGSAALDLAYVASGRFDGFWEIDLNPWDVAAGILLVKEAGGIVSNFDRSEYILGNRTLLASNGLIHNEAAELITTCSLERKR